LLRNKYNSKHLHQNSKHFPEYLLKMKNNTQEIYLAICTDSRRFAISSPNADSVAKRLGIEPGKIKSIQKITRPKLNAELKSLPE